MHRRRSTPAAPARRGAAAARLPTSANHADYVALIAGLPTQDKPDLFGLPANSDRAVQRRAAADVEANLRALGQGAEATAGFDREKWSASLSPLLTLWQRLASTVEKVRSAAAPAAWRVGRRRGRPSTRSSRSSSGRRRVCCGSSTTRWRRSAASCRAPSCSARRRRRRGTR